MQQQTQMSARSTVLCVEANHQRRDLLESALHAAGFDTMRTSNHQTAIDGFRHILPDLVIIDLDHCGADCGENGGRNGIELCRWIRSERITSRLPIILLSSQCNEADRTAALDSGADDILAVPFDQKELIARIKSLFHRAATTPGAFLKTGTIFIDVSRRQVQFRSQIVSLTHHEFELLQAIAGDAGDSTSNEQQSDEWKAATGMQQLRISGFLESKALSQSSLLPSRSGRSAG